jgi:hypothetical protein
LSGGTGARFSGWCVDRTFRKTPRFFSEQKNLVGKKSGDNEKTELGMTSSAEV